MVDGIAEQTARSPRQVRRSDPGASQLRECPGRPCGAKHLLIMVNVAVAARE